MQVFGQTLDDIIASIGALDVEWMDELAALAIARLPAFFWACRKIR
ncbi:hypothetical protein WG926_18510 [Tistrella sp. BH-R2-4]|uniref:Uncharacterized protein n=1 Tax=Tistrella arctica TaxID=3133430 RepID=A0ABU9YNC9_9PROT